MQPCMFAENSSSVILFCNSKVPALNASAVRLLYYAYFKKSEKFRGKIERLIDSVRFVKLRKNTFETISAASFVCRKDRGNISASRAKRSK